MLNRLHLNCRCRPYLEQALVGGQRTIPRIVICFGTIVFCFCGVFRGCLCGVTIFSAGNDLVFITVVVCPGYLVALRLKILVPVDGSHFCSFLRIFRRFVYSSFLKARV